MEPPDSGHDSKVVIDPLQLTSTIWKRTPTWWVFSVFGDYSSFYGDLGQHNDAPTMLLVCVESDKM